MPAPFSPPTSNTRRDPSGDQSALTASPCSCVSCVLAVPSGRTVKSWKWCPTCCEYTMSPFFPGVLATVLAAATAASVTPTPAIHHLLDHRTGRTYAQVADRPGAALTPAFRRDPRVMPGAQQPRASRYACSTLSPGSPGLAGAPSRIASVRSQSTAG